MRRRRKLICDFFVQNLCKSCASEQILHNFCTSFYSVL